MLKKALMHFNEIIDKIVNEIASVSRFNEVEIKSVLLKYCDGKKKDFSLFLNKISNKPEEDAEELRAALEKSGCDLIKDISGEKTAVSFNLDKNIMFDKFLARINNEDESFGKNSKGLGRKVVVDFSSPNIAKTFHVGHFRTTILGNFVVNLLRTSGYEVVAMNYLGDWGKQFGLVLLGYELYGNESELKTNPLGHLCDIYVRISKEAENDPTVNERAKEIFRAMEEDGEEKYMNKWREFRNISIEKYIELYQILNIKFDVYSGESFYNEKAKEFASNKYYSKFEEKTHNLTTEDPDGSKFIDLGQDGKALIQKSDGTTLYLARDIVAAIDRIDTYGADELVYVVADEQNMHFRQLFHCMELLGYDRTQFRHINYGLIRNMSTRAGNVHFLEDVLKCSADAVRTNILAHRKMEESEKDEAAQVLAVSTLLVADFSAKRIKGYTFDIEKRANCENGSGAYLQYVHCRLRSMEKVNDALNVLSFIDTDFAYVNEGDIHELAYRLIWFEHLVELCLEDFEPSKIVLYLIDLARVVNNLIKKLKVKGCDSHIARARLGVFRAARIVFANAFRILGIIPLTKM